MAEDVLRDVLDQHWQQLRHVEQLRYSFTNIYVVIVAGLLAVAVREGGPYDAYTAGFLTFLSFVGIIINVKLGLEFYHRMTYVLALSEKMGVGREMGRPLGMYGDEQRTGFEMLQEVHQWDAYLLNPPSARTSEFVSPGHWVLLLHVVGLGISVGWFGVTLFGFGLLPGIVTAAATTLVSLVVTYTYTHAKFQRIDELVDLRIGGLPSNSEDAPAADDRQVYSKSS